MTPSPFGKHQRLVARCSHVFIDALEKASCKDCEVFVELDWIVSDDTVVRPDLIIMCGDIPETLAISTPKLVVEILSKSTRSRDLTSKFDLYEHHGVAFYLVLDPDTQETQMWELIDDSYCSRSSGGSLQLSQNCSIRLSLKISTTRKALSSNAPRRKHLCIFLAGCHHQRSFSQ
jgi:Uma2 family endonuclease